MTGHTVEYVEELKGKAKKLAQLQKDLRFEVSELREGLTMITDPKAIVFINYIIANMEKKLAKSE